MYQGYLVLPLLNQLLVIFECIVNIIDFYDFIDLGALLIDIVLGIDKVFNHLGRLHDFVFHDSERGQKLYDIILRE